MERNNPFSFPKSARLLKPADFAIKNPKKFQNSLFKTVYSALDPERSTGRVGIAVSKRVLKSAVRRNRLKRLVREAYRRSELKNKGTDILVIGREYLSSQWNQVQLKDLENVFSQINKTISH